VIRKIILSFFALLSLALCLLSPFFYFWGKISEKSYKWAFLVASFFWFFFSAFWTSADKKRPEV